MSIEEKMEICRLAKGCRDITSYECTLFIVTEFNIFQREVGMERQRLTPQIEEQFDAWLRSKYPRNVFRLSA